MSQGYADAAPTITVGTEAANVINVTVQANGPDGQDASASRCFFWYFADDAAGDTITATAHDGGSAIGTDGSLIELTANLNGLLITEADGDADIDITDAGAFTVYLVLVNLTTGLRTISDVITHAA